MPEIRDPAQTRSLIVEGVSKRFGTTPDAKPVLDEVSLSVAAGEFVTLLGPSGCGKTTLLRIIGGFETPDAGSVRLGAMPLLGLPPNRRPVNTVFQSYALFPHLSVENNVAFGLRAMGIDTATARQRVGAAMEMLRIRELAHRKPAALSGGQRQRVALARAVVCEPEVLLLDEPMSALDAKLRAEVQGELRRLQKRLGKTFVLVTHDQDEAMGVSDRILVMNRGRIEQAGTPAEVYENPRTRFVATFLGAANVLPATRLGLPADRKVQTPWGPWPTRTDVPWQTGWISIRPERIQLTAPLPAAPLLIEDITFRGDHRELRIIPAGPPPEAETPIHPLNIRTAQPATPGQPIGIHIQGDWVEVLEGA